MELTDMEKWQKVDQYPLLKSFDYIGYTLEEIELEAASQQRLLDAGLEPEFGVLQINIRPQHVSLISGALGVLGLFGGKKVRKLASQMLRELDTKARAFEEALTEEDKERLKPIIQKSQEAQITELYPGIIFDQDPGDETD